MKLLPYKMIQFVLTFRNSPSDPFTALALSNWRTAAGFHDRKRIRLLAFSTPSSCLKYNTFWKMKLCRSVSDPYTFNADLDPAKEPQYKSGSGPKKAHNPDPDPSYFFTPSEIILKLLNCSKFLSSKTPRIRIQKTP